MKNLKVSIVAMLLLIVSFTNAQEKEKMNHEVMKIQNHKVEAVLAHYFMLEDALVEDDTKKAVQEGTKLMVSLKVFDLGNYTKEQQELLADIIEDAVEHAEHISESPIPHQREHFKILSKDITDMIAITGTTTKLFEQFCPMYDGGSAWLSMSKEVKNPYYGSKMLKCGSVRKNI